MLQSATRCFRACRQRWLKWRFLSDAHRLLRASTIASDLRLHVPACVFGGQGCLSIGAGVSLGYPAAPRCGNGAVLLQPRRPEAVIAIGERTIISNNVALIAVESISIGMNCLIGDSVAIYDCDFHELDPLKRREGIGAVQPVAIGNNVWLGSRVMVLRGAMIGDNTVVGAGSIVTRPLAANTLAVGVPAKEVRSL